MNDRISETQLPGVGARYTLEPAAGNRLAVICHNDGHRDLYIFKDAESDEPAYVFTLDDEEARQLGTVMAGAYMRPKVLEDLEVTLKDLSIDWIEIQPDYPAAGKSIGECEFRSRTGVTVIAILKKQGDSIPAPRPDERFEAGDTLVTVGRRRDLPAFRKILMNGVGAVPDPDAT